MPCERVQVPERQLDVWLRGELEPVFVRPVQSADTGRLSDFVRALSQASRYQRFHIGLRELPAAMAERFVRYDDTSELALVATVCADGREVAVAEARHAALPGEEATHEFALVVHEAFRRTGLGERLLNRLLTHAREIGLRRLVGDVQHDNVAMLRLAAKLGFALRRHPDDARLARVEIELGFALAVPLAAARERPHAGRPFEPPTRETPIQ